MFVPVISPQQSDAIAPDTPSSRSIAEFHYPRDGAVITPYLRQRIEQGPAWRQTIARIADGNMRIELLPSRRLTTAGGLHGGIDRLKLRHTHLICVPQNGTTYNLRYPERLTAGLCDDHHNMIVHALNFDAKSWGPVTRNHAMSNTFTLEFSVAAPFQQSRQPANWKALIQSELGPRGDHRFMSCSVTDQYGKFVSTVSHDAHAVQNKRKTPPPAESQSSTSLQNSQMTGTGIDGRKRYRTNTIDALSNRISQIDMQAVSSTSTCPATLNPQRLQCETAALVAFLDALPSSQKALLATNFSRLAIVEDNIVNFQPHGFSPSQTAIVSPDEPSMRGMDGLSRIIHLAANGANPDLRSAPLRQDILRYASQNRDGDRWRKGMVLHTGAYAISGVGAILHTVGPHHKSTGNQTDPLRAKYLRKRNSEIFSKAREKKILALAIPPLSAGKSYPPEEAGRIQIEEALSAIIMYRDEIRHVQLTAFTPNAPDPDYQALAHYWHEVDRYLRQNVRGLSLMGTEPVPSHSAALPVPPARVEKNAADELTIVQPVALANLDAAGIVLFANDGSYWHGDQTTSELNSVLTGDLFTKSGAAFALNQMVHAPIVEADSLTGCSIRQIATRLKEVCGAKSEIFEVNETSLEFGTMCAEIEEKIHNVSAALIQIGNLDDNGDAHYLSLTRKAADNTLRLLDPKDPTPKYFTSEYAAMDDLLAQARSQHAKGIARLNVLIPLERLRPVINGIGAFVPRGFALSNELDDDEHEDCCVRWGIDPDTQLKGPPTPEPSPSTPTVILARQDFGGDVTAAASAFCDASCAAHPKPIINGSAQPANSKERSALSAYRAMRFKNPERFGQFISNTGYRQRTDNNSANDALIRTLENLVCAGKHHWDTAVSQYKLQCDESIKKPNECLNAFYLFMESGQVSTKRLGTSWQAHQISDPHNEIVKELHQKWQIDGKLSSSASTNISRVRRYLSNLQSEHSVTDVRQEYMDGEIEFDDAEVSNRGASFVMNLLKENDVSSGKRKRYDGMLDGAHRQEIALLKKYWKESGTPGESSLSAVRAFAHFLQSNAPVDESGLPLQDTNGATIRDLRTLADYPPTLALPNPLEYNADRFAGLPETTIRYGEMTLAISVYAAFNRKRNIQGSE